MIEIDELHEMGVIITLFKAFTDIFTQNLMIKSHPSTGAYTHAANSKTLQVHKRKLAVDSST